MSTPLRLELKNAPIREAFVEIECDTPPDMDLAAMESAARTRLGSEYPEVRYLRTLEQTLHVSPDTVPPLSLKPTDGPALRLAGLQFWSADKRQLVQFKPAGFSFNRLAPYTSLDAYLAEIESAWKTFVALAMPTRLRVVRLRYINRLMLPFKDDSVILDSYVRGPSLPDEEHLMLEQFFNRYVAIDQATKNVVTVVLASQAREDRSLPVIFDNSAASFIQVEPSDWLGILAKINELRTLKNHIFTSTLTDECLKLFQ